MIMHTRQLRTRTCRRATRHFFIPYEAFSCSSSHSSAGNTFLGKREREMLGLGPMLARREAAGGRRMWLPCLLPQSSLGEVVGRGRSVGRAVQRSGVPLRKSPFKLEARSEPGGGVRMAVRCFACRPSLSLSLYLSLQRRLRSVKPAGDSTNGTEGGLGEEEGRTGGGA